MQHVKIEMVTSGVIAKMVLVEKDSSALVWEYSLHIVYWLDMNELTTIGIKGHSKISKIAKFN